MATDWTFLEPWCAALRAIFVRNVPTDSSNEVQVSFVWPFRDSSQRVLSFMIGLEAEIPRNVFKLIQIQEAIELFTVLSNVDNKAFRERFQPVTQWTSEDDSWYPSWRLNIRGSATLQQATWSSLFESSDTSPQFQRAIEKLKRMELEDTSKDYLSGLYDIRIGWACKSDGADVNMYATLIADSNEMFIKTVSQRLFKAGAPLVKQLGLTGDATTLIDWWRNQSEADEKQVPMDISLSITIRDFTTTYSRILTGLAWIPIRSLEMFFNKGKATLRAQIYSNRDYPVVCCKFMLKSDIISNSMLAAIYSIQAMRSDTDPIWIYVDSVDSESWPLLMRLICCGPAVGISLTIRAVHVTNSDLVKIADVTVSWRSRIGNGVSEISHDTEGRTLQVSSEFCRLQLSFTDIESGALVINLLGLIGRNLRSLTVIVAYSFDMTLDLSQLSATCPNLEHLLTCRIHVVVSGHTDALRLWPIQDLRLDSYSQLSDLTLCLQNPTLRMTHELMSIRIREFRGKECNEGLKRDLLIHDGDFLSIRKEKVPIRSKVAMISAVSCARKMKAVHGLHEDVLGLIFVFASTPATRSVCFWTRAADTTREN